MKKIALPLLLAFFLLTSCESAFTPDVTESNSTVNGSYANLLVIGDFMYVINIQNLATYNVADANNPELINDQEIGFNIESLLHFKGNLFIGSADAMHIFKIGANGIPDRTSITSYGTLDEVFCRKDPIAVNEQYAFASLSSVVRNDCFRTEINEVRIYNISDTSRPSLISTLPMDGPKGIALDGNTLFVAESNTGLKIYDVSYIENPVLRYHFDGFRAYDLIPDDGLLIVVGPEKIYEYDYTDIENVTLLGTIDL